MEVERLDPSANDSRYAHQTGEYSSTFCDQSQGTGGHHWLIAFGRMRDSATIIQARPELPLAKFCGDDTIRQNATFKRVTRACQSALGSNQYYRTGVVLLRTRRRHSMQICNATAHFIPCTAKTEA